MSCSNNAGVFLSEFLLSKDNIELQFATNHLGKDGMFCLLNSASIFMLFYIVKI